jgi:hypothetical protein
MKSLLEPFKDSIILKVLSIIAVFIFEIFMKY